MDNNDYTPDFICHALGAGPFLGAWGRDQPRRQLRLVFCPSFAPEVCLTFALTESHMELSVATSRNQIWSRGAHDPLAVDRCSALRSTSEFEPMEMNFRASLGRPAEMVVMIDGMRVHAAYRRGSDSIIVSESPAAGEPFARFCADAVQLAFGAIDHGGCRNGLAGVGRYLDLELPEVPESDLKPISRISILGARADTAELLSALRATDERRRKPRPETKKPHRPKLP